MKDALIVTVLSVLPRKHGARSMGWFARGRTSRLLVKLFARAYGIDTTEMQGSLADYPTLEAFFTRQLRPGARPVDDRPSVLVSPVDGRVAAVGRTEGGRIEVAPDRWLTLSTLLDTPLDGERDVAVLYLSPHDYHRVHVPREGLARRWKYLPGTLWPVFPAAVRRVEDLFSRNERAVVSLQTDHGDVEVVLVGAFGVGRITLSVCDLITNLGGRGAAGIRVEELDPPLNLDRGELGIFHLGSTVVLVAEPGRWRWTVPKGEAIKMGQCLGQALATLEGPTGGDQST